MKSIKKSILTHWNSLKDSIKQKVQSNVKAVNDLTTDVFGLKTLIDYFKILGIEPTKDFSLIRSQYRKLVSRYHPDKNSLLSEKELGAINNKMQSINHAYTKLEEHYQT